VLCFPIFPAMEQHSRSDIYTCAFLYLYSVCVCRLTKSIWHPLRLGVDLALFLMSLWPGRWEDCHTLLSTRPKGSHKDDEAVFARIAQHLLDCYFTAARKLYGEDEHKFNFEQKDSKGTNYLSILHVLHYTLHQPCTYMQANTSWSVCID
jgi:hypothetical protein